MASQEAVAEVLQDMGHAVAIDALTSEASWLKLKGHTDVGTEISYLYNVQSRDVRCAVNCGHSSAEGSRNINREYQWGIPIYIYVYIYLIYIYIYINSLIY